MSDPDALRERLQQSVAKPIADLQLRRPRRALRRVRRPLLRAVSRFAETILWRGLDTRKMHIDPDHFHPDRVNYQPSGWRYLRRGLRKRDISSNDVFVDFGAGKGRILCQAARYPFGRVMGVEISGALVDVARGNVERNRDKFVCKDVELVKADVLDFEIPDDVTVAYFYHPFAGKTFEAVIDRLVESIDRKPRRLTIIYACPGLESYILATGRFELRRTSRGGLGDFLYRRVSVYAHNPERFD
jgi:precorrin-6B methylase 2